MNGCWQRSSDEREDTVLVGAAAAVTALAEQVVELREAQSALEHAMKSHLTQVRIGWGWNCRDVRCMHRCPTPFHPAHTHICHHLWHFADPRRSQITPAFPA